MKKRNKNKTEYYGGKIKKLVEYVADISRNNPKITNEVLHQLLKQKVKGYGNPERCFNCGRSMKVMIYEADLLDALLILAIAKKVRENINSGMTFTEANKVHLPTLETTNSIIKRNTKCDYLGLVKQPDNWRGTGYWLLTGWAWKALRGEEIPAKVKYWEGNLLGRSEEKTTLTKMFNKHRDLVKLAIQKRRAVRSDHRAKFDDYDPREWAEFGGVINQGNLLDN